MRPSSPMPRATSCTSAPSASHSAAISLMKLILVARKALEAYLTSSAVSRPVTTIGTSMRFNGRYSARNRASARSLSTPMTIRSGRMKSAIAAPSRRNSGFEATSKSAFGLASATIRLTCRAVPTGTVDLSTITL